MDKKIYFKSVSILIFLYVMIFQELFFHTDVYGEQKRKFTISQAVILGKSESNDYRKVKSKILMKEVKYKEAVKSIALKKKNMSTFRWTPLLSFKFPEKATLSQEYEFVYKPLQIQSEISSLKHQLDDIKYEVTEEVSNLYTKIYTYQEKISYEEQKLSKLNKNLKRNQAKLMVGEAKKSDVDKIESSVKSTTGTLSADIRAFEKAKSDLSDLVGLDLTGRYEFVNPYKESRITRDNLDGIIEAAISKSQSYYEASAATSLALTSVDTNYSLMQRQYGKKMSYISSYVNDAKAGGKIDNEAFKNAYDSFLNAIDDPWSGKKRILFIRIPKEWFKGSIDGVRYVEDDPYILYSNVLEYQDALNEQKSLEKEITKSVKDGFENLVTAKNSYDSLNSQKEKAKKEMEKSSFLNKAGELTFEEYEETREHYEELQINTMEALELYTTLLYSYDRLTYGSITALLNGGDLSLGQGIQGESFVKEDLSGGAYYYILNKVEDNIFELGIHIPEDYETDITHFELWVDGVQIGERTQADTTLRHLGLTLDNTEKVIVRLYAGNEFVADCEIEPQMYQGKLKLNNNENSETEKQKDILGTYSYTLNKKTKMITFKTLINKELEVTAFLLKDAFGNAVYTDAPIPVDEGLTYLSVLSEDFSNITIELYGENGTKLYTGMLDTNTKEIIRKEG